MAITPITLTTKFREWKDVTNQIITELGDNTTLTTTVKTSLVLAVNELDALIGDLTSLNTTIKTDLVAAINEVLNDLGDISTLAAGFVASTDVVEALNELLNKMGDITALTTTDTTNLVLAINSVKTEVGDLSALTTTDKSSYTAAINEVDADVGDLATLTTTANTSTVAAVNELDGEIGDLSTLSTTAQANLVVAINEVDLEAMKQVRLEYSNAELNAGRFATDDLSTVAVTTFDDTGTCVEMNSSVFSAGDNFINDNSNHGGAGAALGADMNTLVNALQTKGGRTELRYGYEFYILEIAAGVGTTGQETYNALTYNPVVQNADIMLGPIGSTVTFQCWLKLKSLDNGANLGIKLGDTAGDITTYVDGVLATQESILTVAMGWVHLKQTITLTKEFNTYFPAIYANNLDVVEIALPVLIAADYPVGYHVGLVN